jgi:peptide/nickel transport system permease protein
MLQYVGRRLLASVPVLIGVSIIVFFLLHLVPGDIITVQVLEMGRINPAERARLEQELGLDKPVYIQFFVWAADVLRGDLGTSLWTREPVLDRILRSAVVSAELAVLGLLVGVIISIPLGVLSAVRRNSPFDYGARLFAISGLSIPDFWIATMLLLYLSLWFKYTPPLGYVSPTDDLLRNLQIMLLPALILGFRMAAVIARMARSSMLEVLRQDYVRTARAKGLGQRAVIQRHAMRNALIPVTTILGSQFAYLLGGTIILEVIFSIPGIGGLTFDSILKRDYTQVQGNVLFFAVVIVLMNILVDVSYGWLDPRIRVRR